MFESPIFSPHLNGRCVANPSALLGERRILEEGGMVSLIVNPTYVKRETKIHRTQTTLTFRVWMGPRTKRRI